MVVCAPAFAGGRLRIYNQILLAAARASSFDAVELVLDERLATEQDLVLRVLNARGDPLGLPAPHRGVIRTAEERALWRAALLDVMPETLAATSVVERFLPPVGTDLIEANLELWKVLLPELRVRLRSTEDDFGAAAERAPQPALVWIGAHQAKALAELGLSAEEMTRAEQDEALRYRPGLQGALTDQVELLHAAVETPMAELRTLALEVDPSLMGAWSRMERSFRKGMDDFAGAAERSLDNHSGIRRSRWRALSQALRPAGQSQEDGLSLLAAAALFGLQPGLWREHSERLRDISTRFSACVTGEALFLTC